VGGPVRVQVRVGEELADVLLAGVPCLPGESLDDRCMRADSWHLSSPVHRNEGRAPGRSMTSKPSSGAQPSGGGVATALCRHAPTWRCGATSPVIPQTRCGLSLLI